MLIFLYSFYLLRRVVNFCIIFIIVFVGEGIVRVIEGLWLRLGISVLFIRFLCGRAVSLSGGNRLVRWISIRLVSRIGCSGVCLGGCCFGIGHSYVDLALLDPYIFIQSSPTMQTPAPQTPHSAFPTTHTP